MESLGVILSARRIEWMNARIAQKTKLVTDISPVIGELRKILEEMESFLDRQERIAQEFNGIIDPDEQSVLLSRFEKEKKYSEQLERNAVMYLSKAKKRLAQG
jgi:hypothetical protein